MQLLNINLIVMCVPQYVANQLKDLQSFDIIILKDIITRMTVRIGY